MIIHERIIRDTISYDNFLKFYGYIKIEDAKIYNKKHNFNTIFSLNKFQPSFSFTYRRFKETCWMILSSIFSNTLVSSYCII